MPIPPLYGHEGTRHRLAGATASGRLPQALLLEGPPGVGKQRLALWLSQALVCDAGRGTLQDSLTIAGEGCGKCQHCKLVLSLSHPDVHWFVPLELSKKGGDADKQVELVEEALGEEPAADTVFILTTAAPDSLLPTILSRVVRVRVARLADSVVAAFAQQELGVTSQRELAQRVALADGRIGRLLADGDGRARGADGADRFLAAVKAGPVRRYGLALGLQPFQARGGFTDMLDGLLERLREQARAGGETEKVVEAIARVLEARGLAQGNVNPQLVAAVLADDLAEPV